MPAPAQYLLRFDDLCPTMDGGRWRRLLEIVDEFELKPILAVVPDNRDGDLEIDPPDGEFWERMRGLAGRGAAMGLHGYRHLCASRGRSLVNLNRTSEFAGVAAETQRAWIREGLRLLRSQGLEPKVWVAPRHGFDRGTLRALAAEGISTVSDGFARVPYVRYGMTWIPQQLWAGVEKDAGLWTICVHPNTASDAAIEALGGFVAAHAAQFTSIERVLAEYRPGALSLVERVYAVCSLGRRQLSRAVGPMLRRAALRSSNSA